MTIDKSAYYGNVYCLMIDWYGPFSSREDASNWLKYYAREELNFLDGIYLVRGHAELENRTIKSLYNDLSRLVARRYRVNKSGDLLYIGESVDVARRLDTHHHALDSITNMSELWIGQLTSQRIPETICASWDEREKSAIDRIVAEVTLLFSLKPALNKKDVRSKPRYQCALLNQINSLESLDEVERELDLVPPLLISDISDHPPLFCNVEPHNHSSE